MADIKKTGPVGLRGLNYEEDDKKQSAAYEILKRGADLAQRHQTSSVKELFRQPYERNIGLKVAESGYGESRHDENVRFENQLDNLNEIRANSQPWWEKVAAGVGKMGVLAGTTFVDGVLGTFAGLANLIGDTAQGNIHSAKDVLFSFIDNPFSKALQEINEKAESWMPNYYSEYENSLPWYKKIGTANFIGDHFLKNLGFTIGAAGAALLTGGAAGKLMVKKNIRDAFKGAVKTASGKELKTGADIYKAYKAGDAFMDGQKLTKDLAKAAKDLKKAETKIKLIGGIASAAGEGRIEAISNADDWEKNMSGHLDDAHNNFASNLEKKLLEEHPEYFDIDSEGNPVLTHPEGIAYMNDQLRKEKKQYENAKADIASKKAAIGNSIFGLNLALLGTSNIWQFGRAISGGYTAARYSKNLVRETAKNTFERSKDITRKKLLRTWSNPLMEAQEEMSQSGISEGSGIWGSSYINNKYGSFYGAKIDPDAEEEMQSWLGSIAQGFANSYSNVDTWEEGFIGGITGMLGIPKIKTKTNKKGKKRRSIYIDGEFWNGFKEVKELKKESQSIADALNKRMQGDEFVNYYTGGIRHNKFEADMDMSAEKGDAFEYKNAEHNQMVSDAIMFDRAGRLQDLYDQIEESGTVTLDDVEDIRNLTRDKETGVSIYDSMSDQEVVDKIKKNAEEAKKTVDKYVEISSNLKTLYGDKVDKDVLEELTWGMTQVDNWEGRIKDIIGDFKEELGSKAKVLKDRFGIDIDVLFDSLADFSNNFTEDKNLIQEITDIIDDKNLSVQEGRRRIKAAIRKKESKIKQNDIAVSRKLNKIRQKFNNYTERLEKQREKALAQIEKLEPEQRRLENLRDQEVSEYDEYVRQSKKVLKEALQLLKEQRKKKKPRKGRKFYAESAEAYDAYEAELREQLQQIEDGRADIYKSFSHRINKIIHDIEDAEDAFERDTVIDGRFKKGYDDVNNKTTVIGSGIQSNRPILDSDGIAKDKNKADSEYDVVTEKDAEEIHKARQKSYDLLSQIMDLNDRLNDSDNQLVDPLNLKMLNEKMFDMIKILAVRSSFLDQYQALSEHPELYQEGMIEVIQKAIEEHKEREIKKGLKSFKGVKTMKEFKEKIDEIEEESIIEDILDKLEEGDDDILKKLAKEYRNIEEAISIFVGNPGTDNRGIIGELLEEMPDQAELLANIAKTVQIILDNADTLQEGIDNLYNAAKSKENDEDTKEAFLSILREYQKIVKSKKSDKKDKKPDKKIKKDDKKSKEEDNEEYDDLDEEEEEEEENKGKKKGPLERFTEEDEDLEDDSESEPENNRRGNDRKKGNRKKSPSKTATKIKENDSTIVKALKQMTTEELDEVIDGSHPLLNNTPDDVREAVIEMAKMIKEQKESPSVHTDGEGTNSEGDDITNKKTGPFHRSTLVTGYEIDPLKNEKDRKGRKTRRAVELNHPVANALRALKAYDFVDSGKLGILFNKNPKLKIHYITAPSKKGLERVVLLAIEVTDEVRELGGINPIHGSDGKEYQVVGSLGWNKKNKVSVHNYNDIYNELVSERGNDTSDYIVSKKFVNTISHIYSGRMVKSVGNKREDATNVDLKSLLNGNKLYLGVYFSDSDFRTPGLDDEEVVEPNTNNCNPKAGSVWIMTREADGRFYAKAVQIKRFNEEEYDLDEHEDSPILEEIMDNLRIIADPDKSLTERAKAKLALETLLYFPNEAQFWFKDNIVSLKDNDGNNIANDIGSGKSVEEKALLMAKELQKLNLRFQISPKKLNDSRYKKDIIDSDIITTDLAKLHNVNASFDMPLLDPVTGNPLQNVNPEQTKGHTGKRGVQSSLDSTTILLRGKRYSLWEDGSITIGNEKITDQDLIDEILFRNSILNGDIQPYEGTSDLYIGHYSNGTMFGIYRNKLYTGDDLSAILKRVDKNNKTKKRDELLEIPEKNKKKNDRRKNKEKNNESTEADTEGLDEDEAELFRGANVGGLSNAFDIDEDDNDNDSDDDLNDDDNDIDTEGLDEDEIEMFRHARVGGLANTVDDLEIETETETEEDDYSDEDDSDDYDLDDNDNYGNDDSLDEDDYSDNIGETFNPNISKELSDFDNLCVDNFDTLLDNGFTAVTFKETLGEKGIDISTITDKSTLEGAISKIKCP